MDAEEGGALEAARAPLVQETDPSSPGSPFSRLLSTTSRADELYRTASAMEVLRDFGGVFKDQYEFLRSADAEADAAAEGFYGRSAMHSAGEAAFLSHRSTASASDAISVGRSEGTRPLRTWSGPTYGVLSEATGGRSPASRSPTRRCRFYPFSGSALQMYLAVTATRAPRWRASIWATTAAAPSC